MTRRANVLAVLLLVTGQIRAQAADPTASAPAPPATTAPAKPGTDVGTQAVDDSPLFDFSIPSIDGPRRWWGTADYAFGWIRGTDLPPLVTTSPAGTAQTSAGVLGQPGTTVLFGNSTVDQSVRAGLRLGVGGWLNADRTFGIDVGFTILESQDALFFASSSGNPILARPFTDVTTGNQSSQLVAFPGVSSGNITASAGSNNFYDFHIDFLGAPPGYNGFSLNPLLGYRFLRYTDHLAVEADTISAGASGVVPGTQIVTSDRFGTENDFNGADFGLRANYTWNSCSVDLLAKVIAGSTRRSIGIQGNTQTTVPGSAPVNEPGGGFLALSSNSGSFTSSDWIAIPEIGFDLNWKISPNLKLNIGYSWLYWSQIARAADQVSVVLNPNLFPPPSTTGTTPTAPVFSLTKSDIWVQTLNVGMEFTY